MSSTETELKDIKVIPVAPCGKRHRMDQCLECTNLLLGFWELFPVSPILIELRLQAKALREGVRS